MNSVTIYQYMSHFAEINDWSAHAEVENQLLETRASSLRKIAPKLRYLAKMMGCRPADDIVGRIVHSLMQDAGME